jgi:hypothetical protein
MTASSAESGEAAPNADSVRPVPSLGDAWAAVAYLRFEDEAAQTRTGSKLLSVHGADMLDVIFRYLEAAQNDRSGAP